MAKIFYLSEIVKFAIEKEQESIDLYSALEKKVTDAGLKTTFQRLTKEEGKHKDFYSKMLTTVKPEQSPGVQEDDDYALYMQALIANSRSIPPLAEKDFTDIKAALDYAIAREKDSVLFYSNLKNFLPMREQQDVDIIIHQEERHAAILQKAKIHC